MKAGEEIHINTFVFSRNAENTGRGLSLHQEMVIVKEVKSITGNIVVCNLSTIPFKKVILSKDHESCVIASKDQKVYVIMWSKDPDLSIDRWNKFKDDWLFEMTLAHMSEEIKNIVIKWPLSNKNNKP